MDGKVDIYCEYGFLEKFYASWPQSNGRDVSKKLKHWQDFDELICKHSTTVIMDVDEGKIVEQSENGENPLIKDAMNILLAEIAEGNIACCPREKGNMECHIEDNEGIIYFQDKNQSIFLLDAPSDKCQQFENDFGLIFISNDNITDRANFLFSPDIVLINRETPGWDFIKRYRHPCNSIILVDNYIMHKDQSVIIQEIKSLFDALLPLQLNIAVINIKIFTTSVNDGTDDRKKGKIKEIIEGLRSYNINIEIDTTHKTTADNHDRYLLTNYCLLNSGYGFVLKKSEREKGTSLSVWPLTYISNYGNTDSQNSVYQIIQNLQEKNK